MNIKSVRRLNEIHRSFSFSDLTKKFEKEEKRILKEYDGNFVKLRTFFGIVESIFDTYDLKEDVDTSDIPEEALKDILDSIKMNKL